MVYEKIKERYSWAITVDYIENGIRNATPEEIKILKKDCKFHFKLYDDDGILYYSGYMADDSDFSPLDWAMYDSGCTTIKIRNPKTKIYETL